MRDALRGLVGKPGAPSQVFITSHSGAFESGDFFYPDRIRRAVGVASTFLKHAGLDDAA